MANTLIFFQKTNASNVCIAKHFYSKNINVFENTLATTVNELVVNVFVKLTML